MHLEPLSRLIEGADFLSFREIAMKYLSLKGYRDVEIKDGWNDGGSDFAVGTQGGNPVPLAIQVTVQRTDWQAKVKADCRRAKAELGLTHALYVTARRLAQADFTKVAEDLWGNDGIAVRPVDSQALASLFVECAEADFVLTALGVPVGPRRPYQVARPDLREDAAYSFAFFGDASRKFRNSVVEQTVLSYLTRSNTDRARAPTEDAVRTALQLSADRVSLVSSAIDRMLQSQRIELDGDELSVSQETGEGFKAMRRLRESQWQDLGQKVSTYLAGQGLVGDRLELATDTVLEGAGALFMAAATSVSAALAVTEDPGPGRAQLRKRVREVGGVLTAAGIAERDSVAILQDLADMVSNSEIGRVLMSGELFVSLAAMRPREFEQALGGATAQIYLDASVAIPMLAGLLYEPAAQRFSRAAYRVYLLARRRGIKILLPRVYLEEAASHLIEAHDRYQPLLGRDDDLRFSTNAFVSHFSDLAARGVFTHSFARYADSLGYDSRGKSFARQRDEVMDRMGALLARYDIEVVDVDDSQGQALTYAQEAVAFTAHELDVQRSGRLLDHDTGVIAHFMGSQADAKVARLFCTWDKLHLRLQTVEGRAAWQALDPAMLGDLLVLSSTRDDDETLMTTVAVAMELSEEEGERGAAVLDALVRIETEGMHDAELLRIAEQFKEAYMQVLRDGGAPEGLGDAWAAWKGGSRELIHQPTLPDVV